MKETQVNPEGKIVGNYVLEKVLGQGQFGKVWRARHKDTKDLYAIKVIAIKKIEVNPILVRLLHTEIQVMHDINHQNILHCYECMKSRENYYLVLQYCNQGDMEKYMDARKIQYFEEQEAVDFLKQILNGFAELREHKILHRDFKLANIYINNDNLIIGDFGFAKAGVEIATTKLGSPLTMAPELLFEDDDRVKYDSKADIWSIGVVFFQMIFKSPPFFGMSVSELIRDIRKVTSKPLNFPRPIANETADILRRMLQPDPRKRIEWSELFSHPIFKRFGNAPNDFDEVTEILDNIGRLSTLSRQSMTETRFAQNRQRKSELDHVQFEDMRNFKKNSGPAIQVLEVEEQKIDPKTQEKILGEITIKEIGHRYNHEKNIIMFMVFTAKRIQLLLRNNILVDIADLLFNVSALVLRKAMEINYLILTSLQNRENIFKINAEFFRVFLVGVEYSEQQKSYANEYCKIQNYFGEIEKRMGLNRLPNRYHSLTSAKPLNLGDLEKALRREIAALTEHTRSLDNPNNREIVRLLRILITRIECVTDSSSKFPYIIDEKIMRKFDWITFSSDLDNATFK